MPIEFHSVLQDEGISGDGWWSCLHNNANVLMSLICQLEKGQDDKHILPKDTGAIVGIK